MRQVRQVRQLAKQLLAQADGLYASKGTTWLWERSVAESKIHRAANTPKARGDYQPTTWKHTIENIFREFNAGRDPKARVRPHDLRARGMTMLAIGTGSADAVAEAVGCDVQTARHYIDASKSHNGMEILRRMAPILRGFSGDSAESKTGTSQNALKQVAPVGLEPTTR